MIKFSFIKKIFKIYLHGAGPLHIKGGRGSFGFRLCPSLRMTAMGGFTRDDRMGVSLCPG
jgi:hypothetical protein